MRVISGKLKGKRLFTLKGLSLRPTSDRVKEAVFDILQSLCREREVLDLFAGTGALGIEALSRGASRAVFIEGSRSSLAVLRRNLEGCGLNDRAEVVGRDVPAGLKALERRAEVFDLIFLDPPYGKGLAGKTLEALSRSSLLAPHALIVAEHSPDEDLSCLGGLERLDWRKYGGTEVSFLGPREKK